MSTVQPTRPDNRVTTAARDSTSRWRTMLPPAAVLGTLAVATIALHVRDPHEQGSWGECPTKAFFGLDCPGCGGLRAVNDLTNLRIIDAASSNLLFVATLPVIAYVFGRWSLGCWRGQAWTPSERASTWSALTLVAAFLVFAVLRNVPAGSWLAP
ncbi:DUF2752 domain-containing protein [Nocardioides immobilis]|uniref:DUF2752 domain-containing protein n=1 Tax=Nocardioides immobilis TaxID=2049295 RepID=A0A417XY53_9ACTN|nr:DUF2752 domain-containing protein [Nocardioides immobilis]RHW25147.1 DUF2752 domain-containing protein [Nocardioides immobilis]